MSFKESLAKFFGFDAPSEEGGDHDAAEHLDPDGPQKDWAAADFDESMYVDDDWVSHNVLAVEPDEEELDGVE